MYRDFVDSREGFDATTEAAMEAQEKGYYDAEYEAWLEDLEADCDDDYEDDGQPTEYEEWQDYMGGDDWDHGQYDE